MKTSKVSSKKSSVRLPVHIIPERYKIMLKPDLDNFTFQGEETIFLKLDKPTKQITLHSSELEIWDVEFIHDSHQAKLTGKISYQPKSQTVTFTFPRLAPKGKGQLKLTFKGILNDKMRGFYRSQYQVDGQVKHMATTQFESTDARRAFPCFDEPSVKAIFDVTLMIPAHTVAIGNTLETTVTEHASGYKLVEFAPTPKMSTYLLAFIVGEFEYIEGKTTEGVTVRVFVTPGKKAQAKFALDVAVKTLSFFNHYFGVKYPLPVMDLIAIPDFAAGAMENWGAVTYRESALLVDAEHSSLGNRQWVALVIAHELAHQWFGNLVTMEWWTHLWLNEGFASYIEYVAIDHLFPQWDIWTQFVYLDQGVALELDGLIHTHAIEVEVGHPDEISEIFDKVSYSKGASVIKMLANYLGPKNFQRGLQKYLKKHEYANAKTEDLWAAFEEVSGKNVKDMMTNWTSKPGYPVLTMQEKKNKLVVYQSRFFSSEISSKQIQDRTTWSVPLFVATQSSKKTSEYLMQNKKIALPKPKDSQWIKLNANEVSFLRVDYPVKYLHLLKKAVEQKQLTAVDRLGVIRDSFALSEAGKLRTNETLNLAQSYKMEMDLTVWCEIASGIDKINNLLACEKFYEQFRQYGKELFADVALEVGWEKKIGEKHTQVLLRSLALYHFGTFGDLDTILKAQQMFADFLTGKSIDPDIRGVVYNLVAENGGQAEHQQMIDLYKKEPLQQEQERFARALGLFKDQKLLKKTLEFALSEDVRLQNSLTFIAAVWVNPAGRDLAWEFVQQKWSVLKEKYSGGHLLSRLVQMASEFTTKQKAKEVENFFKDNPAPDAARTIRQSLEQIYSNDAWLKRDKKGIKQFLSESVLK